MGRGARLLGGLPAAGREGGGRGAGEGDRREPGTCQRAAPVPAVRVT